MKVFGVSLACLLLVLVAVYMYWRQGASSSKTVALVKVTGSEFVAYDPTNEPAVFTRPLADGEVLCIPYTAIKAIENGPIVVDGAVIFFLDRALLEEFDEWYHQVGSTNSYNVIEICGELSAFNDKHNTKVDYIISEGEDTNFPGDGSYTLDLSLVESPL